MNANKKEGQHAEACIRQRGLHNSFELLMMGGGNA
jgi:hypothetical protein